MNKNVKTSLIVWLREICGADIRIVWHEIVSMGIECHVAPVGANSRFILTLVVTLRAVACHADEFHSTRLSVPHEGV
jgi:hypothetical protein